MQKKAFRACYRRKVQGTRLYNAPRPPAEQPPKTTNEAPSKAERFLRSRAESGRVSEGFLRGLRGFSGETDRARGPHLGT